LSALSFLCVQLGFAIGIVTEAGTGKWGCKRWLNRLAGWLAGRSVGRLVPGGICNYVFLSSCFYICLCSVSLAPCAHLRPIAVNIKLQQFSMTRLDWSRRRELHFGAGAWAWAGKRGARGPGNSGGLGLIEPHPLRSNNHPVGGSGPSYYELLQQIASNQQPATSNSNQQHWRVKWRRLEETIGGTHADYRQSCGIMEDVCLAAGK